MRYVFLPLTTLLIACSVAKGGPTEAEMDRVERALAGQSCVGDLKNWDRRYFYGRTIKKIITEKDRAEFARGQQPSMWTFDHDVIEVDLRQGGYEEFGFGRKSYNDTKDPPGWLDLDDRSYKMALGTYDLTSGTLHLRSCGQNMAP